MSDGNEQFVRQRSRAVSVALATNLGRLARGGGRGLGTAPDSEGTAAVIIGGGPSCNGFDRIDGEPLIFAVNTAAPKVCRELSPDVLCVREVVNCADQLRGLNGHHLPRHVAIDVQVHPDVAVAAGELGVPVVWTIPAQQHLYWLAALLDERPIYAGDAALTQCSAMATRLGCTAQSLIGVNLAFGKDGTAYGHGTAWSGVAATVRPDGFADMGDRGGMRDHAAASGVPGPPLVEASNPVLLEDGTSWWALATWTSQRLWLEQWAKRQPEHRRANLSGGARIEGWPAAKRAIPGRKPEVPLTTLAVERIEGEVRRQIRLARDIAEGSAWDAGDLTLGAPLVEMAAAAEYLSTAQRNLPDLMRINDLRAALREAADVVERAYGG